MRDTMKLIMADKKCLGEGNTTQLIQRELRYMFELQDNDSTLGKAIQQHHKE